MPSTRARRTYGCVLSLTLLLVAAGCNTNPPPPANGGGGGSTSGGPQFVINSPDDGSLVSGPVFFSVQPMTPGDVHSVHFDAGGTTIAPQYPGEDMFKVFLLPRDFADGDLMLTATVTGHDGRRSQRSIAVTVVSDPPSQAVVTGAGAILGTVEENGATSVLNIPAGVAEGANVSFEARSQEQVKQATGVDYEALGVTFLGAQEIITDRPIDQTLMVASGGFGPMVQPGQAVVNYLIVADGDGNGIGELVVANTASVAPNGDVVADPVPMAVAVGSGVQVSRNGATRLDTSGQLEARWGDILEIDTIGFNMYAPLGARAEFDTGAERIIVPAMIAATFSDSGVNERVVVMVPSGVVGSTALTLRDVGTGRRTAPISLMVSKPAEPSEGSAATVLGYMAELEAAMATALLRVEDPRSVVWLQSTLGRVRGIVPALQAMSQNPTPAEQDALLMFAHGILNSRHRTEATGLAVFECSSGGDLLRDHPLVGGGLGLAMLGFAMGGPAGIAVGAVGAVLIGIGLHDFASDVLDNLQDMLGTFEARQTTAMTSAACTPPPPRPNNAPGAGWTGMGSAPPPGGSGAGTVLAGPSPATVSRLAEPTLPVDVTGRFAVKLLTAGAVQPFTGVTDAAGYFYLPFVPQHQPFVAMATDTATGEVRTFEGIGPEVGQSVYMVFDFATPVDEQAVLGLDTMLERVVAPGDSHAYTFLGSAGQTVRAALHTDVVNPWSPVPLVAMSLVSPSGDLIGRTNNRAQYDHVHTIWPVVLEETGSYVLVVSSAATESVAYTLGLVEVGQPSQVTVSEEGVSLSGEIDVLHGIDRFSFEADAFGAMKLVLTHPPDSQLETSVHIRRPDGQTGPSIGGTSVGVRSAVLGPHSLQDAGTYVLEIEARAGNQVLDTHVGAYEAILFAPPTSALELGTTAVGTVGGQAIATYSFGAEPAEFGTIAIAVTRPDTTASTYGTLDWFGGGFSRRIETNSPIGFTQLGHVNLSTRPGVIVNNLQSAPFDYRLAVLPLPQPVDLGEDRPTLQAQGAIERVGEVLSFVFAGTAGEIVRLTLDHPSGAELHATAEMYVSNPPGSRQTRLPVARTSSSNRSDTVTVTLPATGSYLIDVSTMGNVSGGTGFDSLDQVLGPFELVLEFE